MGIHKTVRPTNRRTRASLPADFTLDHDETTGHRLRRLALDPRIDEFLLDGRAVREVSARALGLLVAIRRLADARGAVMALIDPSPELIESIERRGLAGTLLPPEPAAVIRQMWPRPDQMSRVLEPMD
ncbi:MAG: STAS domain-containing protein [Frankiaceae bacterium]|nr:STAS domain-containing protein [Frankiaceae bacterium]MBV9869980.1 STAS domain-containing protein [Frankiaceae bacterium]